MAQYQHEGNLEFMAKFSSNIYIVFDSGGVGGNVNGGIEGMDGVNAEGIGEKLEVRPMGPMSNNGGDDDQENGINNNSNSFSSCGGGVVSIKQENQYQQQL